MAIPALEYREQLLSQGCEEGLADVVLSLVEAASNDAEAAVIMKVGERIARSEQQLAEHAGQFRDVDSAIRESALETTRALTARIEQQTAQTNQQIAQTNQQVADLNRQVADLNRQTAQLEQKTVQIEQQIAQTNQQVAELSRQVGELNRQTAQLEQKTANLEQQVANLRVELAELRVENERGFRELVQVFSKGQDRMIQGILGIAALIVGAVVAIISALAVFG